MSQWYLYVFGREVRILAHITLTYIWPHTSLATPRHTVAACHTCLQLPFGGSCHPLPPQNAGECTSSYSLMEQFDDTADTRGLQLPFQSRRSACTAHYCPPTLRTVRLHCALSVGAGKAPKEVPATTACKGSLTLGSWSK